MERLETRQLEALNRLKTKKETCPELIAYISHTLPDDLYDNILNFLEPLQMDTREWKMVDMNIIKFARKVTAEWDEEGSLFRPCEEYRRDEEWIIHWMNAETFVELAYYDLTGLQLDFHFENVKSMVPGKKLFLVLEGLAALFNRAKTAKNRVYQSAVSTHMGGPARGSQHNNTLADLDVEKVEMALINLQLRHEIRVVQTTCAADSAEWVSILAADIATIPYRYLFSNA